MDTDQHLPHSAHDYKRLVKKWRTLARTHSLPLHTIAEVEGHPILAIDSYSSTQRASYYISAGVHGDEPAPVWAVLQWAQANPEWILKNSITILPCLNPTGLIDNTRTDFTGCDLNRAFQDSSIPLIAAWQKLLADRCYTRALCLHEDYDATGTYLYEITDTPGLGRTILDATSTIIAPDTSPIIDGNEFQNALAHHPLTEIKELVETELAGGWPEALYLAVDHVESALTFETPSEFGIGRRIAAHRQAIDSFTNK